MSVYGVLTDDTGKVLAQGVLESALAPEETSIYDAPRFEAQLGVGPWTGLANLAILAPGEVTLMHMVRQQDTGLLVNMGFATE